MNMETNGSDGNETWNESPTKMYSPLLRNALDTLSGFNTSLADKVISYRNDTKRYKTIVQEQKNLLRDTEAFLESVFLDGKWEKRLICSGLGRIIGGIRDGSLDRVTIIRQLALIVNLVHNSIENPVLYSLSDNDEKDFVQMRPIETINAILQRKYETIELMQGYHRLVQQYQRVKQQYATIVSSKRSNSNQSNGHSNLSHQHDTSGDNLNDSGIRHALNGDKHDETLEKLIDLLELEAEGMMPLSFNTPNTSFVSVNHHRQPSTSSGSTSLASTGKSSHHDHDKVKELQDMNKSLSDEVNRYKLEKNAAIVDLAKIRDYASELQIQLDNAKKTHSDMMYDLRLSNELLRLREVEATNRWKESQSLVQAKDDFIKTLEANLAEVAGKYDHILSSSRSKEDDLRRMLEDRDKERSSLVDSLAQVSSHLSDMKREYSNYKSTADAASYNLNNQVDNLTLSNNELGMELALLKQKLSLIQHHDIHVPSPTSSSTQQIFPGTVEELSAQIKKLIATLGESEHQREVLEEEMEALRSSSQATEEKCRRLQGEAETMEVFHNMKLASLQTALDEQIRQSGHYKLLAEQFQSEIEEMKQHYHSTPTRSNAASTDNQDDNDDEYDDNSVETVPRELRAISPVVGPSSPMLEGDSMDGRFAFLHHDDEPKAGIDTAAMKQHMLQVHDQAKTMAKMLTVSNKEVNKAKKKLVIACATLTSLQQEVLRLKHENQQLRHSN